MARGKYYIAIFISRDKRKAQFWSLNEKEITFWPYDFDVARGIRYPYTNKLCLDASIVVRHSQCVGEICGIFTAIVLAIGRVALIYRDRCRLF